MNTIVCNKFHYISPIESTVDVSQQLIFLTVDTTETQLLMFQTYFQEFSITHLGSGLDKTRKSNSKNICELYLQIKMVRILILLRVKFVCCRVEAKALSWCQVPVSLKLKVIAFEKSLKSSCCQRP